MTAERGHQPRAIPELGQCYRLKSAHLTGRCCGMPNRPAAHDAMHRWIVKTLLGIIGVLVARQMAVNRLSELGDQCMAGVATVGWCPSETRQPPRSNQAPRPTPATPATRHRGRHGPPRNLIFTDLGVIPSLASEVNCRVAEEFFSVAVPVVAFPTGALPEVVEDGVSGRVTRSHQPQALAEALEGLIADGALRETLGAGGRREAERRFSKSRFLAETLAAFEEARARRRNQG